MTDTTEIISIAAPVVSANWLHSRFERSHIKVLDGSWYMPQERRNPFKEYQAAHIPGALFFDLDGIVDVNTDLPHMLPSEDAFAAAVSALGITNKDIIIVYDGKGLFSAPRIWWMFRVFGHDDVWVLDGGLPEWQRLGFEVQSSPSEELLAKASAATDATKNVYLGRSVGLVNFQVKLRASLVWNIEQVQQNIGAKIYQYIDARSKGRFNGTDPEPRKGIKSGHIEGSKCVPFPEMFDQFQILLPANELTKKFKEADVSLDRPIIVSCGSGITACIVLLGLYRLGKHDVPLYDGSWTEWALKVGLVDQEN